MTTTPKRVRPSDLVGVAEIAARFELGRTTVSNWHRRSAQTGFPTAVAVLEAGPVFDWVAVLDWWVNWVPERGRKVGTDPRSADVVAL